ncbi:GspE/PulE family protein [Alicyclobacillus fodiniaquatilis]|uniref:GspE/PulE family protein n=1 Tax=Alicyclobacillus fodiniaquatilis TaxID=1661150 RepID=A0ABW4JGI5_9BACL
MEVFTTARILQQMMDYAIDCGATDIHLCSTGKQLQVDLRVAGELRPFVQLTDRAEEIVRRIKAMARMDVTDRQMPQEGVFSWNGERSVRIRVSSLPIYGGESVVLRVLQQPLRVLELHQVGLTAEQFYEVVHLLEEPVGLVLVAGRTGVGKTTTLYAMMHHLANQGRQVFSIEDPVEVPIPHCRQVEVRERTGLSYEVGLRSLLRQDPDVLMIGEIRDEVTARVAVRAALTGRLVLATTHAANFQATVSRLVDLGVPAHLLDDVLRAVIIQNVHRSRLESRRYKHEFQIEEGSVSGGEYYAVWREERQTVTSTRKDAI